MDYNRAILVGRISQAPELRSTSSGQPVATMGVATNRTWVDKFGKKQESVEYHSIVAWGKLAETAASYLPKGTTVLVEGRLETRTWQDHEGVSRKTTEIIADNIQFGARPAPGTTAAPTSRVASAAPAQTRRTEPTPQEEPVIRLDGDEEDTGRDMQSLFEERKVEDGDVPF